MKGDNIMVRKYRQKIVIVVSLCLVFTTVTFHQLHSQVRGTQTQEVKWLANSALRSWFSNMGAEIEFGRRDRQTYVSVDQIDGLTWPNEFNVRMKGVKAAKALWIGTTNFADPVANTVFPYKVINIGKDAVYSGTEIFADELSLIGSYPHPSVFVDNTRASARDYDDILDREDNTQPADRVMLNRFHTSIGITVTRKILSFSQQYHNNYYVYEYTLKNSGIIDEKGQQKLNKKLTGVVLYLQNRLAFAGVSYNGIGTTGAGGWAPATTTWGRNTINDAVGQDEGHSLPAPNNFRAVFSYWGPMSTNQWGSPAADIGLPGPVPASDRRNVTVLAGYQFSGSVVLHADKGPNNPADDITQPTTTRYAPADENIDRNGQPTQYNEALMSQKYAQYMTSGHPAQTQADQIGKDANGWPTGYGNTFGTDAGGYQSAQGFGPYDLEPGDSVRIVVAEAVAGISWEKANEVAKNWAANNTSEFVLPAGYAAVKGSATTTDANEYKNAWVFSGKDSLFQAFRRAIANYNSSYSVPKPPPPPDKFEVNSGGDRIKITWSNSAESWSTFNGYRLYRNEGRTDTTTYQLIFECNKSNVANSYDDKTAQRGFNYYYYIQTKSDGTDNSGDAALNIPSGEPLVSSRYYTMTTTPAALSRPPGLALTTVKTFSNVRLAVNLTRNGRNDTVRSINYYAYRLPKSTLDSIGTMVRGVSANLNGTLIVPGSITVVNDTVKFNKLPGLNVDITLPNRADTVNKVIDSALAQFYRNNNLEVMVISPVNKRVSAVIVGDSVRTKFVLPEPVTDEKGNSRYDVTVSDKSGPISSAGYTIVLDTLIFSSTPLRTDTFTVELKSVKQRSYKLSEIKIVPNPFNIRARNIQFGTNDPTTLDRLAFFNLPPFTKIRIYTETGDLIETIDHNNGTGNDYWNLLTSSRQVVVSGLYIALFEVTDDYRDETTGELLYKKGETIYKKFIVIR